MDRLYFITTTAQEKWADAMTQIDEYKLVKLVHLVLMNTDALYNQVYLMRTCKSCGKKHSPDTPDNRAQMPPCKEVSKTTVGVPWIPVVFPTVIQYIPKDQSHFCVSLGPHVISYFTPENKTYL